MKKGLIFTILTLAVAQAYATITSSSLPHGTGRAYTSIYPMGDQGLVQIKSSDGILNKNKVNLHITRHKNPTVILTAILTAAMVEQEDEKHSSKNLTFASLYQGNDQIWLPWSDNTIKVSKGFNKCKRDDKLRAGNRLNLFLLVDGNYYLTVPWNAEIEAKLKRNIGKLEYHSSAPTALSTESKTINKWGDSGSFNSEKMSHECGERDKLVKITRESWMHYRFGDTYSDPKTKLINKCGHIAVSQGDHVN